MTNNGSASCKNSNQKNKKFSILAQYKDETGNIVNIEKLHDINNEALKEIEKKLYEAFKSSNYVINKVSIEIKKKS